VTALDQTYSYLAPSSGDWDSGRARLTLATSGSEDSHPHFFSGFVAHPRQSAQALLTVAEVARTRYYEPPGMVRTRLLAADPLVTSSGGCLRFESFSLCCGVHARLDFDSRALDGAFATWGTTNVDFNPAMRATLSSVSDADGMLMNVGHDEVTVTTTCGRAVERKVPLPQRWIKGLAEVQVACSKMTLRHELTIPAARGFLHGLPRSRGGLAWATPAGEGLRLSSRPDLSAVCVAGAERLRLLAKLLPFASSLRVYGPTPGDGKRAPEASAWELVLDDARVTLTLSPEIYRGFSGEGGVLFDLAAVPEELVDQVASVLHGDPVIDPTALAGSLSVSPSVVEASLVALGAAGRVGYDLAEHAFFHRELPFDKALLEAMHPRLVGARHIHEAGEVRLDADAKTATVASGGAEYLVLFEDGEGARCTCPWFAKHARARGPCKHVLAAELALTTATPH
jgi:hypothetical protein